MELFGSKSEENEQQKTIKNKLHDNIVTNNYKQKENESKNEMERFGTFCEKIEENEKKNEQEYYCKICDYISSRKSNYIRHLSTFKHEKKAKKEQKTSKMEDKTSNIEDKTSKSIYVCKECNYKTFSKHNFDRHMKSKKHIDKINQSLFSCSTCNNVYKTKNGLFKHKKKHVQLQIQKTTNDEWKQMIMEYIRQNNETQKQLLEIAKEPKQIINNTNNTFNVVQYLNTECKDAYNITDFIRSLVVTFEDLERIEQYGYLNGIKASLITALGNLEQTKRPIHCTDKKRKQFYVKDEDQWKKDKSQLLVQNALREYNNMQLGTLLNSGLDEASDKDTRKQDQLNIMTKELTHMYTPNGEKTKERIMKEMCDATSIEKMKS